MDQSLEVSPASEIDKIYINMTVHTLHRQCTAQWVHLSCNNVILSNLFNLNFYLTTYIISQTIYITMGW